MPKKVPIILFFVVLTFYSSDAQRANIWHFGSGAGLDFNTNPPTSLNAGQTVLPDNTSTVSDHNGDLLFYTNGVKVWNSNHLVMPTVQD